MFCFKYSGTFPPSLNLVSMTMVGNLYSHTILQNRSIVAISGPIKNNVEFPKTNIILVLEFGVVAFKIMFGFISICALFTNLGSQCNLSPFLHIPVSIHASS